MLRRLQVGNVGQGQDDDDDECVVMKVIVKLITVSLLLARLYRLFLFVVCLRRAT